MPPRKPKAVPKSAAAPPIIEYTIDELALQAGSTVRNVRAYQERGLLPGPTVRGRTGFYSERHLARLRLIGRLLERGYTMANIAELVAAWEEGRDISELLGLEQALTMPWSNEQPESFSLVQLVALFGGKFSPADVMQALQLGLIERRGLGFIVPRPQVLRAGAELSALGVPLKDLLSILGGLRHNVQQVANALVEVVVKVMDRYEGELPPGKDVPLLAEKIGKLRPLADKAINSEVSRAMEQALASFLGERMAQVLDHLQVQKH